MLNKFKKALLTVGTAGALLASVSANAIVVGGIDFGVLGDNPINTHFETATLAQTLIDGDGQSVTSYGRIDSINGETGYCAGGGTCRLYYIATFDNSAGFEASGGTFTTFDTAKIDIYFAETPIGNLLTNPGGSPANLAAIEGLQEWVRFTNNGDTIANGVLVGAENIGGDTFGLFDVDTSGAFGILSVADFLDGNSIPDLNGGFADISVNASFDNLPSRLNPFDVAVQDGSCADGSAGEGDWCFGGTANIAGKTNVPVPEPATLALLGLGLMGFGRKFRRA